MGGWYILAVKMLEQRKVSGFGRRSLRKFWTAGTVGQGTDALHRNSPTSSSPLLAWKPPRSTAA